MSPGGDHGGGFEDDQVLVAEFALGLLEGGERAALARRIASEPALAADLRLWRLRLSSLDAEYVAEPAPGHILPAIEKRVFGDTPAASGAVAGWWNSLAVWRGLAAAGYLVAVLAIGYQVTQPPRLAPAELATQLVAALRSQEGSGVEFVAFYDAANGSVRIAALSGAAVPDRDYELWMIKGQDPAVSMGVIPVDQRSQIALDAARRADFEAGTVLAVTLEPRGGSPTGVATGPIVSMGPAVPI